MEKTKDEPDTPETPAPGTPPLCSCVSDPFSDLPPELRPHARKTTGNLRKVTCAGCGLVYWTNPLLSTPRVNLRAFSTTSPKSSLKRDVPCGKHWN